MQTPSSVLIVIPTYNERENITTLASQLRAIVPHADLLFVDDESPDGTGAVADSLASQDAAIHVLHRPAKEGLGRAYVAGLGWGIERGYAHLVQMDADLSHDPQAVPRLLDRACRYDLVVGSRYVPGGGTRNWRWPRRLLSRVGSSAARHLLHLPYRDLTGGFKCWQRATLQAIDLTTVQSSGYAFQIEMNYRATACGASIAEEPILFTERAAGCSKMSRAIAFEALTVVLRLWRENRENTARRARREPSHVGS